MTREIKFRAWLKTNKIMTEIDKIDFINNEVAFGFYEGSIDAVELMQYTGLKDKNGKEVYEGDLFYYTCPRECLERLCKITYCPDKMGIEVVQICENEEEPIWAFVDGWETYETAKYLTTIEIIGNIYENPELLEDK